jgi:UDP-N-acetylmuramyl pentapeptide phosphotransferase/UDP-N-acetylglucosamine-1-phosphate transferase
MTIQLLCTALLATGASAAASVLIVFSQKWHGTLTFDHDLTGIQKFHQVAVPRVGGLAIVVAIFVTLLFCAYVVPDLISRSDLVRVLLLLIAGLPAFLAGITEDLTKKVSVKVRLFSSMLSALAASWLLGATIDELNIWGVDAMLAWTPFALIVTAVTVAGGVNAINIIDGFNGLAGTTVVIMLAAFGAVGWHVGDMLIVELSLIGLGAALGFLTVNYPKGHLFLGDGGAYFLGFWVAEMAVLLLVRNASVNAWQALSICAYPIIEVVYSIYRRKILRHASPSAPDALHLHTLVYRRVVSRILSRDAYRPWTRNAAVTCIIAPWIIVAALLSVTTGGTILSSMGLVVAQIGIYIVVYARLVRGKWGLRLAVPRLTDRNVNAKAL